MVLTAIFRPTLSVISALVVLSCGVVYFLGDWWRRLYFVTLLLMASGISHLESLVIIAGIGKVFALGLLALVTLMSTRRTPRAYIKGYNSLLTALWGVVGVAAISMIWSQSPTDTFIKTCTLAALVLIIQRLGPTRWQDRSKLTGDVGTMYLATFLPICIGLGMQMAGLVGSESWGGRHQGFFNNPNMLGLVAVLSVGVGIAYAAERKKVVVWISLLAPLLAIILTGSRTALVAVAVGLVWVLVRGSVARMIVAGIVTALLATVAELSGNNPFQNTLDRFTSNDGGDLLNHRSSAWWQVLDFVQVSPLGVGWGATLSSLETGLDQGSNDSELISVHNSYFQIMYEIGWVAIPICVALIVIPLGASFRVKADGIGAGLAAAVIGGTAVLFTESAIFGVGQPFPHIYWIVVAACLTLASKQEPSVREKKLRRIRMAGSPKSSPVNL